MSNFGFLKDEWPDVHESAARAESHAYPDPRTACFYARRSLELAVHWAYKHDPGLKLPYSDNLSALIHAPSFRNAVGEAVLTKAKVVKDLGNLAVHSRKTIRPEDGLAAVRELFHVAYWFARTYTRREPPDAATEFNPEHLSKSAVPKQTIDQIQQLEAALHEQDEKLAKILADKDALDDELVALRAEVANAKQANKRRPDDHDYSEAETRDYFIDLLLKEAGWPLDQERDTEFPVIGMPSDSGEGFADYVLWGDDGLPLAVVEAKRTKHDPRRGKQQAVLYADCLEAMFGRRPVIFYSNGYQHWLWDDTNHPPREVQGFYTKDELELMIQRRKTRKSPVAASINEKIVERYYQQRAIRRIAEAFERDNDRKALLVMATGSGKTRTVIALCDLLMRCNWVKRVLFLADRVALVKQAERAFNTHLPGSSPVNLVSEKDKTGRVYISTYPTMMKLIDESTNGKRKFGVGHFDLVVIDEAHRSVYNRYGAIFDYFDSLLVGLTATPKDEVSHDTYGLFDLERGVPSDSYGLDDAVRDGYLVPPKAVSVPMRIPRSGLKYEEMTEEEKDRWDAIEWDEEGTIPEVVEPAAVNQWLFNEDTVDKALKRLMTRGLRVAGDDRLGKTIIFAKNHDHAEYIVERFDINYPKLKGKFAQVIDFKTKYAQSLIDSFSTPDGNPHIAVSVDMLDTGIDVPEVANLVFFKMVRSKTKFWQMLGRGTRLCENLHGPGQDKQCFYIFDFCQNLEFFSENPETTEGAVGATLGTRLFRARLQLILNLDHRLEGSESDDASARLRKETAARLHQEVKAMNVDNFVVRPKRALVEKYSKSESWEALDELAALELTKELATLPTELQDDDVEAKKFDMLMLRLQLALLRSEPQFVKLRDKAKIIAQALEEKSNIPMVAAQLEMIQELQSDQWWQNITAPMIDSARRRLRELVKLIEWIKRKPVFTDFEDEIGEGQEIALPMFNTGTDFERFKQKARLFLRDHEAHPAIKKLRLNEPLTTDDIVELERLMLDAGVASRELLDEAKKESEGLGLFVRSMIGMDRSAAKRAFDGFISGKSLAANQIEFIDLVINYLTEHGTMDPVLLYESPFTDSHSLGVEGIFTDDDEVAELIKTLESITRNAAA